MMKKKIKERPTKILDFSEGIAFCGIKKEEMCNKKKILTKKNICRGVRVSVEVWQVAHTRT